MQFVSSVSLSPGISGYRSAHRTAAPPLTTTSDIAITRLLVIYGLHCVFRRRFGWLLCAIFVLYRGLSCCCLLIAILLPHWPVGCWLVVATYYLVLDLATRLVLIVHFQLLHFVHIVPFERLNFRKFRLIGFEPIQFNWVWKWENRSEIRKELNKLSVYYINWSYFQALLPVNWSSLLIPPFTCCEDLSTFYSTCSWKSPSELCLPIKLALPNQFTFRWP